MSNPRPTENGITLSGPDLQSILRLNRATLDKLYRAGTLTPKHLALRLSHKEQKRLMSDYLDVPEPILESWRQALLDHLPELANAARCRLGPISLGDESTPAGEALYRTGPHRDHFQQMLRSYDWANNDYETIDLRSYLQPVQDQNPRGFCWAYSATTSAEVVIGADFKGSEAFVVQSTKTETDPKDPWPNEDGGSTYLACINMCKHGLPTADEYPMKPDLSIHERPPKHIREKARRNRLGDFIELSDDSCTPDVNQIGAVLRGNDFFPGRPCTLSIPLFSSFQTVGDDGIVPNPLPGETELGWHAMPTVGLTTIRATDYRQPYVIERNSWSPHWGDNGYCYLSTEYIEKYARRFYSLISRQEVEQFSQFHIRKSSLIRATTRIAAAITIGLLGGLAAGVLPSNHGPIASNVNSFAKNTQVDSEQQTLPRQSHSVDQREDISAELDRQLKRLMQMSEELYGELGPQ